MSFQNDNLCSAVWNYPLILCISSFDSTFFVITLKLFEIESIRELKLNQFFRKIYFDKDLGIISLSMNSSINLITFDSTIYSYKSKNSEFFYHVPLENSQIVVRASRDSVVSYCKFDSSDFIQIEFPKQNSSVSALFSTFNEDYGQFKCIICGYENGLVVLLDMINRTHFIFQHSSFRIIAILPLFSQNNLLQYLSISEFGDPVVFNSIHILCQYHLTSSISSLYLSDNSQVLTFGSSDGNYFSFFRFSPDCLYLSTAPPPDSVLCPPYSPSRESLFASHSLQFHSGSTLFMLIDVLQSIKQISISPSQHNKLSQIIICSLRPFIETLACQKIETKFNPSFFSEKEFKFVLIGSHSIPTFFYPPYMLNTDSLINISSFNSTCHFITFLLFAQKKVPLTFDTFHPSVYLYLLTLSQMIFVDNIQIREASFHIFTCIIASYNPADISSFLYLLQDDNLNSKPDFVITFKYSNSQF